MGAVVEHSHLNIHALSPLADHLIVVGNGKTYIYILLMSKYYMKSRAFRNLRRNLLTAATVGALTVGGIGYLEGCPPPQRIILPSQRSELARFKAECEKDSRWVEMGSPGYNTGDRFLPEKIVEKRAKIYCAEHLYRIAKRN